MLIRAMKLTPENIHVIDEDQEFYEVHKREIKMTFEFDQEDGIETYVVKYGAICTDDFRFDVWDKDRFEYEFSPLEATDRFVELNRK